MHFVCNNVSSSSLRSRFGATDTEHEDGMTATAIARSNGHGHSALALYNKVALEVVTLPRHEIPSAVQKGLVPLVRDEDVGDIDENLTQV